MYGSWDIVHDKCNCYFSFRAIFCPFTPQQPKKPKFWKNEKRPGDIIILNMCTKNYDQIMHSSWDMLHDRCNYFSFWAIFCPFTPLTAWKIKILKNEKNIWRYHHFTYEYQKLWSDDVQFLRYAVQQTDRWMDGKRDIQRWVPHLKTQNANVPHQPNVIPFNLKFLSTSAPLKETINITLDRIYHQREINTSISKKNMHNLLLCTKTVYFCFNGKIY